MAPGDDLGTEVRRALGCYRPLYQEYLAGRVHPIHTFLYQLVFSIPIIFLCMLLLENKWIINVNTASVIALLYASIIVAFASYLTWFKLIHTYPVSQLAVFHFPFPVFRRDLGGRYPGRAAHSRSHLGVALCKCGHLSGKLPEDNRATALFNKEYIPMR